MAIYFILFVALVNIIDLPWKQAKERSKWACQLTFSTKDKEYALLLNTLLIVRGSTKFNTFILKGFLVKE